MDSSERVSASPTGAGPAQPATQEAPYPSNFYAWYCVFVLLGIYLNSFLDRQILSLLVGPIKTTMNLTDSDVGFLQGMAFALFYTFAGLPLGWLADRMSRRVLISVGQIFWSIASVGFGLAKSHPQMIAARVGVGVGEASLSPSAYSMLADLFPPKRLARAISIYAAGIYLGGGLATVIGGHLADYYPPTELVPTLFGDRFGWQMVFFFIALPTIPLTLMLLTVKEPTRRGLGQRSANVPMGEFLRYWWSHRSATLTHAFGFALLSLAGYGASAWIPEYFIRVHGWTRAMVGTNIGLTAMVVGPTGLFTAGWIADRLTARGVRDAKMRVGMYAALAWLPFGIAVPLMPTGALAMVAYVPALFFSSWSWGIAPAAVQEMMPNQMRGQASAVYLFILNLIGLGCGPWVLGFMTSHVFADDSQIHLSLLTTTVTANVLAVGFLFFGLKPFRQTRDRLDEWLAGQDTP